MMEPSIDSEEDAAMPFPDSVRRVSFRDALRRIPKPALAGAAVLLFCAFAGVVVGFESCAPEPTFTLSKSAGEPSDADEADVSEDEPGDWKSEGGSGFSAAKDSSEAGSAPSAQAVVYVSGAVASPGVYMLAEGSRVGDAVSAAGGFRDDAAQEAVNLARKISDGEQIAIPTSEQAESGVVGSGGENAAESASPSFAGACDAAPVLVNINTAGIEELDSLAGVGPATAQAIVDEREANGPFSSIEDIQRVSGIGEKKFEKLKESICV